MTFQKQPNDTVECDGRLYLIAHTDNPRIPAHLRSPCIDPELHFAVSHRAVGATESRSKIDYVICTRPGNKKQKLSHWLLLKGLELPKGLCIMHVGEQHDHRIDMLRIASNRLNQLDQARHRDANFGVSALMLPNGDLRYRVELRIKGKERLCKVFTDRAEAEALRDHQHAMRWIEASEESDYLVRQAGLTPQPTLAEIIKLHRNPQQLKLL